MTTEQDFLKELDKTPETAAVKLRANREPPVGGKQ